MWETWVRSLGQEDPLEKGKTTHSSILGCKIPWTEKPGIRTSLVVQWVKNLPAMKETWVRSLGQEDPLEKEMATHFSSLA